MENIEFKNFLESFHSSQNGFLIYEDGYRVSAIDHLPAGAEYQDINPDNNSYDSSITVTFCDGSKLDIHNPSQQAFPLFCN